MLSAPAPLRGDAAIGPFATLHASNGSVTDCWRASSNRRDSSKLTCTRLGCVWLVPPQCALSCVLPYHYSVLPAAVSQPLRSSPAHPSQIQSPRCPSFVQHIVHHHTFPSSSSSRSPFCTSSFFSALLYRFSTQPQPLSFHCPSRRFVFHRTLLVSTRSAFFNTPPMAADRHLLLSARTAPGLAILSNSTNLLGIERDRFW